MSFQYEGTIPASKSLMNRALICLSYQSQLILHGSSSCDDVVKMQQSVRALLNYNPLASESQFNAFDAGAAGTVFRFLSLRLSRLPGRHFLKATPRLMQRPHGDLFSLFSRFGVKYELQPNGIWIETQGWKNLSYPIQVAMGTSSQFASGLLLNAWGLEQDLVLQMSGDIVSEGYWEMTLQLVQALGMQIAKCDGQIVVAKQSAITATEYTVESDLSSVFAVAAYAALNGPGCFKNFPHPSLQPDFEFVAFMRRMNIPVQLKDGALTVLPAHRFSGVEADLKSCPDLFPVLAVLCAFANTPSRLYGAPQLVHKESNRIAKISELLAHMQVPHESKSDGMIIHPRPHKITTPPFQYDTDHDHRLAFAAALARSQNIPVHILHPEVVAKSFPEFWQVIANH